jgi:hypothetical protein
MCLGAGDQMDGLLSGSITVIHSYMSASLEQDHTKTTQDMASERRRRNPKRPNESGRHRGTWKNELSQQKQSHKGLESKMATQRR